MQSAMTQALEGHPGSLCPPIHHPLPAKQARWRAARAGRAAKPGSFSPWPAAPSPATARVLPHPTHYHLPREQVEATAWEEVSTAHSTTVCRLQVREAIAEGSFTSLHSLPLVRRMYDCIYDCTIAQERGRGNSIPFPCCPPVLPYFLWLHLSSLSLLQFYFSLHNPLS